jgi:UDPglucose--hexose-1-phosphate uridylyltransferase
MMSFSKLANSPHRRFNPLLREWVLVSPQRNVRPWQGRIENLGLMNQPQYDPNCYLCPGNERANGARTPAYTSTFVFENDYPAMMPGTPESALYEQGLLRAQTESGICRVVCFSPRHDSTIPRMPLAETRNVINAWTQQFIELEQTGWVRSVLIFENKGQMIGASNPHPHCQIWANATLPNLVERELSSFSEYFAGKKSCLLCDYLALELQRKERIICENENFAALVPFWAVWPFETLVLSKRHAASMPDLSNSEKDSLADLMKRLTIRYDNLFESSFPYSMGFHQRPADSHPHPEWHFHAHYYPPLLRSATVQKFIVGYELLGTPQRDLSPEEAASRLAACSEIHYLDPK